MIFIRRYGDFHASEDAVQEALLAAAVQWPEQGIPDNPRAWLIHVAGRRMQDHIRSELARRHREAVAVRWELPDAFVAGPAEAESREDEDDTLILLFMCCHPALTRTSAIALTLRAVAQLEEQLEALVRNFDRVAVPEEGKYVPAGMPI